MTSLKQLLFLSSLGIVTISLGTEACIPVEILHKIACKRYSRAIAVEAATFIPRKNHGSWLTFHGGLESAFFVTRGGDASNENDDPFLENEEDIGKPLDVVVESLKKQLTASAMSASELMGDRKQKSMDQDKSAQDENMAGDSVNVSDTGFVTPDKPVSSEPSHVFGVENEHNGESYSINASNPKLDTPVENDNPESSISEDVYEVENILDSSRGKREKSEKGGTDNSFDEDRLENDDAYDPWKKEISRIRDFYKSYRSEPKPDESTLHGSESNYIERGEGFIRLRSNSYEQQHDSETHLNVQPHGEDVASQVKENNGFDCRVPFVDEPPEAEQPWTDDDCLEEASTEKKTQQKPDIPNSNNNYSELDIFYNASVVNTKDDEKGMPAPDDAEDETTYVPDINIPSPEYEEDNAKVEILPVKSEEFPQHESSSIINSEIDMEDDLILPYRWEQSKEVAFNKLVEDGLNRLRRKKGDQPSVPYIITRAMRKVLVEKLGYQEEEVAAMRPDVAVIIVGQNLQRPSGEDLPSQFYNEPSESNKAVQVAEGKETILDRISHNLLSRSDAIQTSSLFQLMKPSWRKLDTVLRGIWHGMNKKSSPKYSAIVTALLTVSISFFRSKSSISPCRATNDYFVSDSQTIRKSTHESKDSESNKVVQSTDETDETVLVNDNPVMLQNDLDKTWLDKLVSFVSSAFGA
ncbi:hypothetical protein ACHAXS_007764 [Conticribra weissflogii]